MNYYKCLNKIIKYLLFLCFSFIHLKSQNYGKVVKIKDGDTIVLLDSLKKQITIRLAEVDTPEKNQSFGTKAKQFTSSQVFGKNVKYNVTDIDRNGRLIAKIYYDKGKYLSKEIIKSGYGWWFYKYSKNRHLGNIQEIAKRKKLGLWSESHPVPPWEFRKKRKKNI